ncbi:McrB family protein [Gynuella sunshinyii]|uniref:GTPase subunit of restriction endonuclease n=1 Tax=Gynuella sunshinyii YC6258 TaxID=1445510 RepID=A0A0C5VDR1_9GAMM|nr:hypothetical protein [Gynuella sunshinyii]AJQ97465.1 GTPase subunit of restriction endonuclease [Gynuella sunshinyii YC6258]
MNLSERQQRFKDCIIEDPLNSENTKFHKLFGVSNSAKVIEGGLQLGVVNLDNVKPETDGFIFACVLGFPPEDEVYFAVFVKSGAGDLIMRLNQMRASGAASKQSENKVAETAATPYLELVQESTDNLEYSHRNNLVAVYLADDGKLYLRNKGFWDSLRFDRNSFGDGIAVDKISTGLYPPAPSARRSLLAREFVGFLGKFVGRDKVHEVSPWPEESNVRPAMKRLPHSLPLNEISKGIQELGGYYIDNLIERYHAGLNYHPDKHFVILAGLSGTGKTNLAIQYARSVHGLENMVEQDPFLFICPVRPEWTDPTGLTGYYDVLSDRYIVPPFLEAVLVATANPETPVFVCLDEMNLARVEYYFSDVLSSLESGHPLQLHSNSVPLEGSTGGEIRADIPLPRNLYIIGTINIDETTNPLSDKILDRSILVDMSQVDLAGYFSSMKSGNAELTNSIDSCGALLSELNSCLAKEKLGFGYRTAREALLYHHFNTNALNRDSDDTIDEILIQKIMVKLRGSESQRNMLNRLEQLISRYPRATQAINELKNDLDEMGSFQASR